MRAGNSEYMRLGGKIARLTGILQAVLRVSALLSYQSSAGDIPPKT
jgi:fatty acid-binding protein DegV